MTVATYLIYLVIAIGLTIWVAHSLSSNGKVFLIRCFGHDDELATSINHLLVVGFYLVNLGFIAVALSVAGEPTTIAGAVRLLAWQVGIAILVLGFMHFFNMGVISRYGVKLAGWIDDQQMVAGSRSGEAGPRPERAKEKDYLLK